MHSDSISSSFAMKFQMYFSFFCAIFVLVLGQDGDDDSSNPIPSLVLACKNEHCTITQREYLNKNRQIDFIISACPAPENINNQSFTAKSLLARIYKTVDMMEEHPEEHFCQSKYEPSMVLRTFDKDYDDPNDTDEYEVGYELYFVKNTRRIRFISKIVQMKLITQSLQERAADEIIRNYRWLPILSFKFNKQYTSVHQVQQTLNLYDFDNTDLPLPSPCPHYNLGNELFTGLNVENLYSTDYQFHLFHDVYKPKMMLNNENLRNEYFTFNRVTQKVLFDRVNERLSMHQLVSHEDFPFYPSHLSTCTYMNTIPLWEQPAFNWILINVFVRELARHIKKLEVVTGTHNIEQLPRAGEHNEIQNAYLYKDLATRKIPIPKILYKAIKYPVYLKNPKNEIIYYSFIIIMHNNAKIDAVAQQDKICQHNVCEQLGCQFGQTYFHEGTVYCCRADEETLRKLNIKHFPPMNDFNLKAVDLYGDNFADFQYAKDLSKVTGSTVVKLFRWINKGIQDMKSTESRSMEQQNKNDVSEGSNFGDINEPEIEDEHHLKIEKGSDEHDDSENSITRREGHEIETKNSQSE